jgi:DNA-binding transcriptional ArsR family regulator
METGSAIAALGALAQGTRLDVFRLLVRHEPAGMAAGEIARQLDVPQNTMSAHLGIRPRAGLSGLSAIADRSSTGPIWTACAR